MYTNEEFIKQYCSSCKQSHLENGINLLCSANNCKKVQCIRIGWYGAIEDITKKIEEFSDKGSYQETVVINKLLSYLKMEKIHPVNEGRAKAKEKR